MIDMNILRSYPGAPKSHRTQAAKFAVPLSACACYLSNTLLLLSLEFLFDHVETLVRQRGNDWLPGVSET